ncbi:MAG: hypothetical protein QOF54_427 [Solirubrobacteraceae bacterium]|jgi:hypothetical protein|nr:hypothetical protein [Solirubrobacteraceae bacterium]
MPAVPIKPAYGPTLGRLLSPWWRASSSPVRAVTLVLVAGALALAIGAFFTLENAHYSHGGHAPFGFSYRGLYRVAPEPGGYVRLERHYGAGRLEDSFAVGPLALPPYAGGASGELPVYAAGYLETLRARDDRFVLRSEGKTRVNGVPAYQVVYTERVDGHTMWGRNVLLLPERAGARQGVTIVMLTSPEANAQVTSPLEVASAGVLLRPLKTLALG